LADVLGGIVARDSLGGAPGGLCKEGPTYHFVALDAFGRQADHAVSEATQFLHDALVFERAQRIAQGCDGDAQAFGGRLQGQGLTGLQLAGEDRVAQGIVDTPGLGLEKVIMNRVTDRHGLFSLIRSQRSDNLRLCPALASLQGYRACCPNLRFLSERN